MTIALSDFEGFCGFRPLEQICDLLDEIPEFANIIGKQESATFKRKVESQSSSAAEKKAALRELFATLMETDDAKVKQHASKLIDFFKSPTGRKLQPLSDLFIRLNDQFPSDIGLFCGLLLNYVTMKPGEAMFLQANEPHAYLAGDVVECMAASDNVVRAGFTPKFKDITRLVSMLTYSYAPPEEQKMKPKPFKRASPPETTLLYDPPIEEFSVIQTSLGGDTGHSSAEFQGIAGPSILITTQGSGTLSANNTAYDVCFGSIFFIGANTPVTLTADGEQDTFRTHRAFVEA